MKELNDSTAIMGYSSNLMNFLVNDILDFAVLTQKAESFTKTLEIFKLSDILEEAH